MEILKALLLLKYTAALKLKWIFSLNLIRIIYLNNSERTVLNKYRDHFWNFLSFLEFNKIFKS